MPQPHISHRVIASDASTYDRVCELCGATNRHGDPRLYDPCPGKDNVDHPQHYGDKDNPYEVIKVMEAWLTREEFIGALKFNIHKYLARARQKGNAEDHAKRHGTQIIWLNSRNAPMNQQDSKQRVVDRRERGITHCRNGHELTDNNVFLGYGGYKETRYVQCRTCFRLGYESRRDERNRRERERYRQDKLFRDERKQHSQDYKKYKVKRDDKCVT